MKYIILTGILILEALAFISLEDSATTLITMY